jgi:ADP-dependent NAD(P)H-hydrate dehydratase
MAGSISLSGMACLRSGAGLVTVATASSCLSTVASFEPSYMTLELPEDAMGRINIELNADLRQQLQQHAQRATAIAIGPGIGQTAEVESLVCDFYRKLTQPMVVDADGLNALARRPTNLEHAAGPRILTPHPGEFERLSKAVNLTGSTADKLSSEQLAVKFAHKFKCVMLLKGHQTLITDGQAVIYNTTGNPGMATGGTGDVLTGIITALLCQGLSPLDAAHLGAHVHGLAGDLAAAELGQVSARTSFIHGLNSSTALAEYFLFLALRSNLATSSILALS